MKPIIQAAFLIAAFLLLPKEVCAQSNQTITRNLNNQEVTMSAIQQNKEVIRQLYEQSLNRRNRDLLSQLIAEDYTGTSGGKGIAGFEAPLAALMEAFPDVQWQIEELIGEGDKVVVRQKVQGTHTGTFQHIPPTGKVISNTGIAVYQLREGKIIHAQPYTDRLGFLQQLGVLPADLTLLPPKPVHSGQVSFIDKFLVPAAAKGQFYERMQINRNLIKNLPGFIEDAVYEHSDEKGSLVYVTVAKWESQQAVESAKAAVQTEYKKQGFNLAQWMERLGITMERGLYSEREAGD